MDKTDPSPGMGDHVVLKAWTSRDDSTQSDLTLHCTDVQEQMVDQLKTSKEVWDKLETAYMHYDQNTQFAILKRLMTIKLQEGNSITEFIEEFQGALDKVVASGLIMTDL